MLSGCSTMGDFGEGSTTTPTSVDGCASMFGGGRANCLPDEICFRSNQMQHAHIMALDQLIQYQCSRLERQLSVLKMKRKLLIEGAAVSVSLNELVSDELMDAAEGMLFPVDRYPSAEHRSDDSRRTANVQGAGDEIRKIIESINIRKSSEEGAFDQNRHVQFTAHEIGENFAQVPRRCATLPESRNNVPITNDIQLMLHMQGTCKPCAFFYNKKKGCRNGLSCGFCHHEDHSSCTLKQWKKQQKVFSQSESMSSDKI